MHKDNFTRDELQTTQNPLPTLNLENLEGRWVNQRQGQGDSQNCLAI